MTDLVSNQAVPGASPRLSTSSRLRRRTTRLDRAGILLLLFSALNLNAVILLYAHVQAQLSPLVLAVTLLVLLRYTRSNVVGPLYVQFMVFFVSYLVFAAAFALANAGGFESTHLRIYTATPLLLSALYFWLRTVPEHQFERVLRLFKHLLVAACALTLFSGALSHFFDYVAPLERASGVFENPDEAAVAALYCIVLAIAYPSHPVVVVAQICIAVAALVMTFSKAGFGMLLLIAAVILIRRRSLLLAIGVTAGIGAVLWGLWWAYLHGAFVLVGEQRQRFSEMFSILGGAVDNQTTSGRTLVWGLGLSKIAATIPWGSGLGTFHALEGGYRNPLHEWLGIHNTYLMVLGESGLVPFLLFATFLVRTCIGAYRSQNAFVALGLLLIVCGDMLVSHGVLGFRLADAILAVVVAFGDRASPRRTRWTLHRRLSPSGRAIHDTPQLGFPHFKRRDTDVFWVMT